MKNRKNNKGFSLVELIVVVAIMAVLVGVLAPAYLKYVENSREKKDLNNLEEVCHSVEIALANEDVFAQITTGDQVDIDADGDITVTVAKVTSGTSELEKELDATVGNKIDLVSKKYTKAQSIEITIGADGSVTVAPNPAGWNS